MTERLFHLSCFCQVQFAQQPLFSIPPSEAFPHFPYRPPEAEKDQLIFLYPDQKGLISTICTKIGFLNPVLTISLKDLWEQDLGTVITDNQWRSILKLVHSSSICARHGLLQCKVLHRAHLTNAKLANIYSNHSDACNRCRQSPADHLHMCIRYIQNSRTAPSHKFRTEPPHCSFWSPPQRKTCLILQGVALPSPLCWPGAQFFPNGKMLLQLTIDGYRKSYTFCN